MDGEGEGDEREQAAEQSFHGELDGSRFRILPRVQARSKRPMSAWFTSFNGLFLVRDADDEFISKLARSLPAFALAAAHHVDDAAWTFGIEQLSPHRDAACVAT